MPIDNLAMIVRCHLMMVRKIVLRRGSVERVQWLNVIKAIMKGVSKIVPAALTLVCRRGSNKPQHSQVKMSVTWPVLPVQT